jgi:hypothetical protein
MCQQGGKGFGGDMAAAMKAVIDLFAKLGELGLTAFLSTEQRD